MVKLTDINEALGADLDLRNVSTQEIERLAVDIYREEHSEELFSTIHTLLQKLQAAQNLADEIAQKAIKDPLTGLFTRAAYNEFLEKEFEQARRYKQPLGLLLGDLDNFKSINDTYGHPAGDAVLAEMGHVLEAKSRTADICARLGGDEFAIILPNSSPQETRNAQKRFQDIFDTQLSIQWEGATIHFSGSIGQKNMDGRMTKPAALHKMADANLYRVKEERRKLSL